jgi:hypothetical protein
MAFEDTPSARLLRELSESYHEQHKDELALWSSLESKAQGLVTIASIFLSAVLAFQKDRPPGGGVGKAGVIIAVVAAVVVITLAAYSMRIRRLKSPPIGLDLETHVTDLIDIAPGEIAERESNLLRGRIKRWRSAVESIRDVNHSKTELLKKAFVALGVGIVTASILVVMHTLSSHSPKANPGETKYEVPQVY